MKAKIVALFCIVLIPGLVSAQQNVFNKIYFDDFGETQAYAVLRTFDDHYMVAGTKDYDAMLMCLDTSGNILWDKKYGNSGNTLFSSMIQASDSSIVVAGQCDNAQNFLCMKVKLNGDTVWSRAVDLGGGDYALAVVQTNDKGYILCGYSYSGTMPRFKIAVVKLDSAGNLSWARKMYCGNFADFAFSVKQTADSGYVVIGSTSNNSYMDSTLLIKLTATGNVAWINKFKINGGGRSGGHDIMVTNNGLLCYSWSDNLGLVFVKTDFSGGVIWSRQFNYPLFSGVLDFSPKIKRTADSGFIFVSPVEFISIDSGINVMHVQYIEMYSSDVVQSKDKGFLIVGNGPLLGVKKQYSEHPQIGVVKADSSGYSTGCIFPFNSLTSSPCTVIAVPVTAITTDSCTLYYWHPPVTNAGLTSAIGCVATLGSINESQASENILSVYPNPGNGIFKISFNKMSDPGFKNLAVYNALGAEIFRTEQPDFLNKTIDISREPDGIYFMRVTFAEKEYCQKIIICH